MRNVKEGMGWVESHAHGEASAEMRAALGVLRNVVFTIRRLANEHPSDRTDRLIDSCQALLAQSGEHLYAVKRLVEIE